MDRMLQRCNTWDYRQRGIYMVTLTTEGRAPLFGRLVGGETNPSVRKSLLGEIVAQCWADIPAHFPGVSLIEAVVMPDHFHGILFIRRRQQKSLGAIVGFLKAHSTSLFLRSTSATAQKAERSEALCQHCLRPEQAAVPPLPTCEQRRPVMTGDRLRPSAVLCPAACGGEGGFPRRLWAPGYHDRLLFQRGQLERLIAYVRDNPRRLAIKRAHPELFRVVRDLPLAGRTFSAIGNHFLLEQSVRLALQCSRSISPEALARQQARFLALARQGAVIISPCISPGEKQIARAALAAQLPLVVLLENGFPPLYKPPKAYFEACAAGRLLMLSPWPYHPEKRPITRAQCLTLNSFARQLATPDA